MSGLLAYYYRISLVALFVKLLKFKKARASLQAKPLQVTAFCKYSVLNATNGKAPLLVIVVVHSGFFVVAVNVHVPCVICVVRRGRPKVAVITDVVIITGVVTPTAEQSRTLKITT